MHQFHGAQPTVPLQHTDNAVKLVPEELVFRLEKEYGRSAVADQMRSLVRHGPAIADPERWLRAAVQGGFRFMPIELVKLCPCGEGQSEELSRFVYWNLLSIRQCCACGLAFVSPRLTADALKHIFEEHYFSDTSLQYWDERRELVFQEVIEVLHELGARSVFDVGAAYGHFVRYATDAGFIVSGCDVSGAAVRWGRERLGADLVHGGVVDTSLADVQVDAVTSLDTLYYVPDLNAELQAMRRILKPGGHLFLRLRNCRNVARRARRESRKAIGRATLPMPHIWAFTPSTITNILKRNGFEDITCEPAAYSRSPLIPWSELIVGANRSLCRKLQFPILTLSFNVVARKP
jgi:SAM-dependent methyltransferase